MDVDEQDRPQPKAEEGYVNAEEVSAGPSTTLLEKLSMNVDKLIGGKYGRN